MSSAAAVSDGPLEAQKLEGYDFARFTLDLLTELHAAHPAAVNLLGKNGSAIDETQLKQIWSSLKKQEIICGELEKCALTTTGRQSVQSVLVPQHRGSSEADDFGSSPSVTPASTLLLGVMRHHFALQANTN